MFVVDLMGWYLFDVDGIYWVDGLFMFVVWYGVICYFDEIVEVCFDVMVVIYLLIDLWCVLLFDWFGEVVYVYLDFYLVILYNFGYYGEYWWLKLLMW